ECDHSFIPSAGRERTVDTRQHRITGFFDAEATHFPSGLNATRFTRSVFPSSLRISLPLAVSQSRTVLSSWALASTRPFGPKATLSVEHPAFMLLSSMPVATLQIRSPARLVASSFPSGLRASPEVELSGGNDRISLFVWVSHSLTPSPPVVARIFPSLV